MDNWRAQPPAVSRAMVVVVAVLLIAAATLIGAWLNARRWSPAGRLAATAAAYRRDEGPSNRGPAFERYVLELDDWRRSSGATLSEAQMVQAIGPPDLMERYDDGGAFFAYFYDRYGQDDWVTYFEYRGGTLTVGGNAAWVNAQTHAQMVPYAPPGMPATASAATKPATTRATAAGS